MADNNTVDTDVKNNNGKNNVGNRKNNYRKNKNFKKKQKNNSTYVPPYDSVLMSKSVQELDLTARTVEILIAGGVDTLGKICSRMMREMYSIQFIGKKQLNEISQVLKTLNVDFRPSEQATPGEQKSTDNTDKKNNSKNEQKGNSDKDKQKAKSPKDKQNKDNQDKSNETKKGFEQKKDKNKNNEPLDMRKIFPKPAFVPTPPRQPETDRFIKFQKGGKWGFKDKNGKEVIPPIYDEVFNFKDDVACVERKELFGYITRDNEMIIPYKYQVASSFSEGLACVGNDSKCGYINKTGEVVIPFIYDAGTPFVNGIAQVKQKDRWGTYDIRTKEVNWNN